MSTLNAARSCLVTPLVAVALVATASSGYAASPQDEHPATHVSAIGSAKARVTIPTLTKAEVREWKSLTNTPAKRAKVIKDLSTAFAGVATVSGKQPTSIMKEPSTVHGASHSPIAVPDLAYGYDNGHVWIIASYADVAAGAVWGAVRYCSQRLPGWLCSVAGNMLTSWSRGWGWASNHGVWAAIYWYGRIDGGRW